MPMKKRTQNLILFIIVLVSVALPLLIVEVVAGLILDAKQPPMPNIRGGFEYIETHPVLERQLKCGGIYKNAYFNQSSNDIIGVTYSLDSYRRRITPVEKENRDKFLAFFGCSYVFGWAVNDHETLPANVSKYCREYVPYNYGIPGVATQHMYYRLLHGNIRDEIPEEKGILIYLYAHFHNNRIIGGMPDFNVYVENFPCYEIENDSLIYKGSFREAYPWRSRVYDTLFKSSTVKAFNLYLPLRYSEKHWDTIAAQIIESKRLFQEQFPDCPMVVVMTGPQETGKFLKSRLSDNAIQCIMLFDLISIELYRSKLYPDGHPKPELYDLMAKVIANELQLE